MYMYVNIEKHIDTRNICISGVLPDIVLVDVLGITPAGRLDPCRYVSYCLRDWQLVLQRCSHGL